MIPIFCRATYFIFPLLLQRKNRRPATRPACRVGEAQARNCFAWIGFGVGFKIPGPRHLKAYAAPIMGSKIATVTYVAQTQSGGFLSLLLPRARRSGRRTARIILAGYARRPITLLNIFSLKRYPPVPYLRALKR